MKKSAYSRREFLKEMGTASLVVPFLPSLFSEKAMAQTAGKPPLRMIFISNRNGQKPGNFFPTYKTARTLVETNVYATKLTDIPGAMSPIFSTAWDPYRNKMSLLQGLDIVGSDGSHNHNSGVFLTCAGNANQLDSGPPWAWAASIDWIISQTPGFYTTPPQVNGLRYNNYDMEFSFSNVTGSKVAWLPYINSDNGLFNQAFANLTGGTGGSGSDVFTKRRLAADLVMQRLQALKGSPRIGADDKLRLQQHTDMINSLKATYVAPPAPLACSKPTMSFYSQDKKDQLRKKYSNVNDIIVSAFNCDITRIACYNIHDYNDVDADMVYQHDDISHGKESRHIQTSAELNRWKGERILDLIQKLDNVIEADGSTMLDNTLVFWGGESGESLSAHRCENLPIMIAGGKNIKLKFGYHVDYRTNPFKYYAGRTDFPATGRPYNQLLASIMLAFGVPRADFDKYGKNGKFGEFAFGEYYNKEYEVYKTTYSDKLPFFYTGTAT